MTENERDESAALLTKELFKSDDVDTQTPKTTEASTVGMLVIGASFFSLLGIQFPFLFIRNAPYMATPGRKIRTALLHLRAERLQPLQGSKTTCTLKSPPATFVDLGSGDGVAVYEAAKLGYQSTGVEFNLTLYLLSSLRRQLFWTREIKQRSLFLRQDFLKYNLQNADTIMIFGVPRTMPLLGKKIQSECAVGTNILSYRFAIPLIETKGSRTRAREKKLDSDETRLHADCFYDREEMKIYRKVS